VVTVLTLGSLVAACGGASDIAGDDVTGGTPTTETQPITPDGSTPTDGGPGGLPQGFVDPPPGTGLDRYYDQTLAWADCGGGAECATLLVPLDYEEPDGQAISLALKRQRAADQSNRVGSLLINPGGPGASGVDYLSYAGFDSAITDVYDVVGFDPRGVARSTPVDCLSDEELDAYIASDPTPDDDAEVQQLRDDWSNVTAGCVEKSGPLLEHLSTVEAARDMDVMRQVLGDASLNFFGASYGTYLGATYAALFPDKVGRFVLDGAVDPVEERRQTHIDQAAGFEAALTAYLEFCVAEGGCPLGDDVDSARQALIGFFEAVDANPLPSSDGRPVTEGVAQLGVALALYARDLWPALTAALVEASGGRGDTLLLLADAYSTRQKDGTFADNRIEAQPAVNCLDHPEDETLEEIQAGADDFLEASPVFGPTAQWWPYGCSNWPVESSEKQPDFAAEGAAPIVVVGTTRDPATPYQSAVDLADTLDSGVLLSRDGDGHTAYGAGNDCIDAAIHTFLVEGTPPADGTQC
jgi:pimeloyl-ACP methyl ester carboxylesterase